MKHFLSYLQWNQRGAIAVEAALLMALTVLLLPTMVDLAGIANASMHLRGAVRVGTEYAVLHPTDTSGITSAIQRAGNYSSSNVTVTTSSSCECSGVSATCGTTCSGGVTQTKYLTINTVRTLTVSSRLLSSNGNYSITRSTTVRTQ